MFGIAMAMLRHPCHTQALGWKELSCHPQKSARAQRPRSTRARLRLQTTKATTGSPVLGGMVVLRRMYLSPDPQDLGMRFEFGEKVLQISSGNSRLSYPGFRCDLKSNDKSSSKKMTCG